MIAAAQCCANYVVLVLLRSKQLLPLSFCLCPSVLALNMISSSSISSALACVRGQSRPIPL